MFKSSDRKKNQEENSYSLNANKQQIHIHKA